jgi:hypothetical protein
MEHMEKYIYGLGHYGPMLLKIGIVPQFSVKACHIEFLYIQWISP